MYIGDWVCEGVLQAWSQLTRKFACGPWVFVVAPLPPQCWKIGWVDICFLFLFFLGPFLGFVDFNFEGACGRNNDQGVLTIFWLIVTGVVSKSSVTVLIVFIGIFTYILFMLWWRHEMHLQFT